MRYARHLILSGENITPEEAYRVGLVNRVVARKRLEEELREWAERCAEVPASTLKWVKHLTNQAMDIPFETFLEEMDKAMRAVLVSEEHLAARQAWRERRDRRRREAKKIRD